MEKIKCGLYIFILSFGMGPAWAQNIQDSHDQAKSKLLSVDQESRDIMSNLYELNHKMKSASKRRTILDNKMLWAEQSVKKVADEAHELDLILKRQRQRLSQRLRAIYKIGDESIVRSIFSSASSKDLDETIRFLKIISNHDFNLIKNYSKNLIRLQSRKDKLNSEVRKLLKAKENVRLQELTLTKQQDEKSIILERLRTRRDSVMREISSIRDLAQRYEIESLLDISFYENRGQYAAPVKGSVLRPFGIVEDRQFGFRLSHKGIRWMTSPGSDVQAIHKGRVAFVGVVPGHGQTVIIDHGDHYYTVYAQLGKVSVERGQSIKAREQIGLSNMHIYFELRHFSESIDPQTWLKQS